MAQIQLHIKNKCIQCVRHFDFFTHLVRKDLIKDLIITEDFSRPGAVHEEENRRDDNDSWLGLD